MKSPGISWGFLRLERYYVAVAQNSGRKGEHFALSFILIQVKR